MPTTTNAGYRYPDLTSAPNIPLDIGNLASDLDAKTHVTVATTTARDALVKFVGMRVYVTADKRVWLWDGTVWAYAGGAAPPISATLTPQSGWLSSSGYTPGCFLDASGLVQFVGGVTNAGTYTPSNHLAFTVPTGFRPAVDQGFNILVPAGTTTVLNCTILANGNGFMSTNGGIQVAGSTIHTLNQIRYHPKYTGSLPYS